MSDIADLIQTEVTRIARAESAALDRYIYQCAEELGLTLDGLIEQYELQERQGPTEIVEGWLSRHTTYRLVRKES